MIGPMQSLIAGLSTGKNLTAGGLTLGLAIAGLIGGTGGAIAAYATSPGDRDFKNMQRKLLKEKLQWELDMARRRGESLGSGGNSGKALRMGG